MNVKLFMVSDEPEVTELAGLVENMLKSIDSQSLKDLILKVEAYKYSGPHASLSSGSCMLAQLSSSRYHKGQIAISYVSRTKMDGLRYSHVAVSLIAPGSVERVQGMIQKAVDVYVKWNEKPRLKKEDAPLKKKKERFAHRARSSR